HGQALRRGKMCRGADPEFSIIDGSHAVSRLGRTARFVRGPVMLFANVGAMGNAILFICSMVLWVIVLTYTLALALRLYLIVVQGTWAGIDKVETPDEPLLDWLFASLPTVLMMLLCLIPPGLIGRAMKGELAGLNAVERFFLLSGPFLWFFWPIVLLSSMAA